MLKPISIREYARQRGVSDTAVHKAIKAGHIQEDAIYFEGGRRRGIYQEIADKQWSSTISFVKSRKSDVSSRFKSVADSAPGSNEPPSVPAGSPVSTAKAQQVEAVYKAKLRELEYKRKSGELIDKQATYRALFAMGQEIRNALQSIPDRSIDDILAAPSRNDAHTVLSKEIFSVLDRLSTITSSKILEGL